MSEQEFLEWMEAQEYTKVKIKNYKIRDHVWYKTPDGNTAQVVLNKGLHIKDMDPKDYRHIAISKDERQMFWFSTFWQLSLAIVTHEPFKPVNWSIECTRCNGRITEYDWAFPCVCKDDYGEEHELILCKTCDWELMNGWDPFQDTYDIYMDRRERLAAEDPVNYGHLAYGGEML